MVTTTTTRAVRHPSTSTMLEVYSANKYTFPERGNHDDYFPRDLSGTGMRFSTSVAKSSSKHSKDIDYDGVSDDVARLINDHAKQPPTSVSLQALMRTGRGEYLDRHFENVAMKEHTATELVLMQVASFLRRELPIRLAHRVQDLEKVRIQKTGKRRDISAKEEEISSARQIRMF